MIDRRLRAGLLRASVVAALAATVLTGCAVHAGPQHLVDTSSSSKERAVEATPSSTPTPVVTTADIAETAAVPFESTTVNDATVAQGTSSITTAGVAGVQTTTYRVTYVDGVESKREQLSQAITTPPVTQVTTVGTYVAPPPAPAVDPSGGATAQCNDGTYSYAAHHQGACSHHGGVAVFYK